MKFPNDLKYSAEHEWIRVSGEEAFVGITDFAQGELGEIVFVDTMDSVDEELGQNDIFGSIEAVKTVSDLFMPVSGTVLAVNDALDESPDLVNTDPYGDGWLVKIKLEDASQLDNLLSADAYKKLIGK